MAGWMGEWEDRIHTYVVAAAAAAVVVVAWQYIMLWHYNSIQVLFADRII